MTFKNVKSSNPVKQPVMVALKTLTGGQKVTNVQENEVSFRANVFKHLGNRKYQAFGNHVVMKTKLVEMGLLPVVATTEPAEAAPVVDENTTEEPAANSLFG